MEKNKVFKTQKINKWIKNLSKYSFKCKIFYCKNHKKLYNFTYSIYFNILKFSFEYYNLRLKKLTKCKNFVLLQTREKAGVEIQVKVAMIVLICILC